MNQQQTHIPETITASLADSGVKLLMARFVPERNLSGFTEPGGLTKTRTVSCYEAVLFMKDGGKYVIGDTVYPIFAGSVRFHKPGDMVYSHRYSDIYVVHFDVGRPGTRVRELEEIPGFMPAFYALTLQSIMENLIKASLSSDIVEINCCLWELIRALCDNARLFIHTGSSSKTTNVIDHAERFMAEHYRESIHLSDIAAAVHLHPNYFHRLFSRVRGISPGQHLMELRLKKAAEQLITSDKKLDDIAGDCGFCNTSYFIKNFRSAFGMTPSAYRKKNTCYSD